MQIAVRYGVTYLLIAHFSTCTIYERTNYMYSMSILIFDSLQDRIEYRIENTE